MKRLIGLSILVALAAACGQEESPDFQSMRSGGKADGWVDTSLTCQGNCDGIASSPTGYCGCDDLCAGYGDCCNDKVQVCDSNPTANVIVTKADNGGYKTINVGDTLDVQLEGNPTTGYEWELLASSRSFPLQKKVYVPDQVQMTGSGGTYHFYFTADSFSAGNTFLLQFAYYHPWEDHSNAIETFEVKIIVDSDKKQICMGIDANYGLEIANSQDCTADSECQTFVGGTLSCGAPIKAINNAFETNVKAFRTKFSDQGCHEVPWNCPMLTPLPPWYETVGVCDAGKCKVEHIDTRAKEGDACGNDINVQCGDGMYCAFGLNWCGTPPVTGECRKYGDCGAKSDCDNNDNYWNHIMCAGASECSDSGKCTWNCGVPTP